MLSNDFLEISGGRFLSDNFAFSISNCSRKGGDKLLKLELHTIDMKVEFLNS